MCVGAIETLAAVRDEEGTRTGTLADGRVVTLAFLPEARPGDRVLVHLGVPVEILEEQAAEGALALRASAGRGGGR